MEYNRNTSIKGKIADSLELPKEIILNQSYITLIGNKQITIENYKNIIEYTNQLIRLNTMCGIMKISGKCLFMKQLTCEDILICGKIDTIEFSGN